MSENGPLQKRIIVVKKHNYGYFNVFTNYVEWKIVRLFWIAYHKNIDNKQCLFDGLGKDVIKLIITFLGLIVVDESDDALDHNQVEPKYITV